MTREYRLNQTTSLFRRFYTVISNYIDMTELKEIPKQVTIDTVECIEKELCSSLWIYWDYDVNGESKFVKYSGLSYSDEGNNTEVPLMFSDYLDVSKLNKSILTEPDQDATYISFRDTLKELSLYHGHYFYNIFNVMVANYGDIHAEHMTISMYNVIKLASLFSRYIVSPYIQKIGMRDGVGFDKTSTTALRLMSNIASNTLLSELCAEIYVRDMFNSDMICTAQPLVHNSPMVRGDDSSNIDIMIGDMACSASINSLMLIGCGADTPKPESWIYGELK